MSKVLSASCVGSIVTAAGVPVPDAEILSQGLGPSSGILVIDDDEATYVTSSASDLDQALAQVISALNTIGTALTSIAAGMAGPATAPPPTIGVSVAQITAAATALSALKGLLK